MGDRQETMVKTYKETKEFEKDSKKLAKDGWSVASVMERQGRAGVGRMVALGLLAAARPPKGEMVVTYSRWIEDKKGNYSTPRPPANQGAIFCPKCGGAVPFDAQFCPSCGLKRFNPPS